MKKQISKTLIACLLMLVMVIGMLPMPVDGFRLIDAWAEYADAPSSGERKLNYLCYEIEVINPENGQTEHLYKAIKLLRILRLPRSAKESLSFMDMQSQ